MLNAQAISRSRACAVALLACTLTPSWAAIDVTGTLQAGDPVLGANRLQRNGVASACGSAKPFPGVVAEAGMRYDAFTYTNTGPAQCVTFTVTGNCAGPGVLLSAYSGAINPADVSIGYLGDAGTSSIGNSLQPLALDLAAGQTIHLVASNGSAGVTPVPQTCAWRVISSEPLGTGTAAVPTLGEWGLGLLGLLAAGLGARRLRRSRRSLRA